MTSASPCATSIIGERRDERGQLEHGDVEAVDQPDESAEQDRAQHAQRQRQADVDDEDA
jgi:hypothetical protein